MNPLLALTVTAALAGTPAEPAVAPSVAQAAPAFAKEGVLVHASTLFPRFAPDEANAGAAVAAAPWRRGDVTATRAARAFKGDSLVNGAVIGGVLAGAAMGGFIYWLCNALDDTGGDQPCAGPALIWAGIGAAGGAAIGAGVDALVDRKPVWEAARPARLAFRVRVRF